VHKADSPASALSAALPVIADSFRFSLASQGMIAVAATKTAIPTFVCRTKWFRHKHRAVVDLACYRLVRCRPSGSSADYSAGSPRLKLDTLSEGFERGSIALLG
jgi:hypothetical protein